MKKVLKTLPAVGTALALSVMPAFAAESTIKSTYGNINLDVFLGSVIDWAAIIAGVIVLIYLIVAGIKYVTSSGDPGKTEEAQKQIIAAIIGLAIVVLAYAITRLIASLFGLDFGFTALKKIGEGDVIIAE